MRNLFIILVMFHFLTGTASAKPYPQGVHLDYPEEMKDGYKICFLGDTGMHIPTQTLVARAVESENCDQLRILGDLIYKNGIKSKSDFLLQTGFYIPYAKLLKEMKFFLTLGNHDYYGEPDAWLDIAKDNKSIILPSRYYSESWGDVCLITLDSNDFKGERGATQKQWFSDRKKQLQSKCRFSLSMAHHPYLSSGKHGDAKGNDKLFLEDTVIGSTDVYLCGHDHHIAHEGSAEGTELLLSGAAAWIYSLDRDAPAGGYAGSHLGYLTLTLKRPTPTQISADYKLYQVTLGKKEVHSGSLVGQGLR